MWHPVNCAADTTTLSLVWNPSPTNAVNYAPATSYRVYQAVGVNSFSVIMTVPATPTPTAQVAGVDTGVMTRFFVTGLNAEGTEDGPSNTLTNAPVIPPPPTGVIGISVPILTATNLVRGATVTGAARFTNGTTATVQVNQGWLTARQPGASNQSGPFDDWSPGMPSQAVASGQVVTLTAQWIVRADAPFGTWQVHLAVQVAGVYNDGPSAPFNVVSAPLPPPLAPTNLRAVSVGSTSINMTWNGSLAMSTEVERAKEADPYMKVATLTPGTVIYKSGNLQKHRDWRFRVRQVDSFTVSPYSNELFYSSR
jgi:hypothetical protein